LASDFRRRLLDWFDTAARDLPWRRTRDPYTVWVSEIMLQQTRVAAVTPYFHRFLERFPTVQDLAAASEPDVLAAWAGLGYYSRVRNMQRAARIMEGRFPQTYNAIRALPGVGDYTAAAIASIAFGLPHAAVDGNVLRVLSRVADDCGDISTIAVRKRISNLAQQLIDRLRPGDFNQALMELGATICLPRNPQCLVCPVAELCEARREGRQSERPVTRGRPVTISIARTVVVMIRGGDVLLWQRPASSRKMAGFWELPEPEHLEQMPNCERIGRFRHSITNHNFTFEVVIGGTAVSVGCKEVVNSAWVPRKLLRNMALSTTARKALHLYDLYLSKPAWRVKNESIDPNPNGKSCRSPRGDPRDCLGT
jgi:A/G-specific adenine glycosylase